MQATRAPVRTFRRLRAATLNARTSFNLAKAYTTSQRAALYQAQAKPVWYPSPLTDPRRQFSWGSIVPAKWSDQEPSNEDSRRFDLKSYDSRGNYSTISVLPTPKANRETLKNELEALFGTRDDYEHHWALDPRGDAIHAVRFFLSHNAEAAIAEIMKFANDFGHHPHVSYDSLPALPPSRVSTSLPLPKSDASDPRYQVMLITCTTHQPRGLGVRDTKLARVIDKILEDYHARGYITKRRCMHDRPTPAEAELDRILEAQAKKHRDDMDCAICQK